VVNPEKMSPYDVGTRIAHLKQLQELWQNGLELLKTDAFRSPKAPLQIHQLEDALRLLAQQIKESYMSEDAHDSNNATPEPVQEAPVHDDQTEMIDLAAAKVGARFLVRTRNTTYTLNKTEEGYEIWGHPVYCPAPTKVRLSFQYIGRTGQLVFNTPKHPAPIVTSTIQSIVEI